jgi:excinuclease ABC subunit A
MYEGEINKLDTNTDSHTIKYLTGEDQIPLPAMRRKWNNYIELKGVRQNNLRNVDVKIPLGVMTLITGVSGSGKSSLITETLFNALNKLYKGTSDANIDYSGLSGDTHLIYNVELIDQNPVGKSSRSNPVTYIKAYDEIRKLFAEQPLAKQMLFSPQFFSFNVDGGRCDECKGEGSITVGMQFMADLTLECDFCKGKRFKPEILEVEYRGKNIADILDMTVEQACEFFAEKSDSATQRIHKKLSVLKKVGLGYIKLGQSSSSLSGGENQRLKLAYYLSEEKSEPTLFIFDEPTTGLHFHDIKTLLLAFDELVSHGHTLVVIEHNLDVIKCADHIIDLGPEGGNRGGYIVAQGTPEEVALCSDSLTGKFLSEKLLLREDICHKE